MTKIGNILKTLLAQADSRNMAKNYIRGLARPFIENINKLMIWGNTRTKNHWLKELNAVLYNVLDIKLKNKKRPKSGIYKEALFNPYTEDKNEFTETIEKLIKYVTTKEDRPYPYPEDLDIDSLWLTFQRFEKEFLSVIDSPKKVLSIEDFTSIIDEIIKKD